MNLSEWLTWSSKNLGSSAPDNPDKTGHNPVGSDFCLVLSGLSGSGYPKLILETETPETARPVQSEAITVDAFGAATHGVSGANTPEASKSWYFHGLDVELWSRPDETEVYGKCHPNPSTPAGWTEGFCFSDRSDCYGGPAATQHNRVWGLVCSIRDEIERSTCDSEYWVELEADSE